MTRVALALAGVSPDLPRYVLTRNGPTRSHGSAVVDPLLILPADLDDDECRAHTPMWGFGEEQILGLVGQVCNLVRGERLWYHGYSEGDAGRRLLDSGAFGCLPRTAASNAADLIWFLALLTDRRPVSVPVPTTNQGTYWCFQIARGQWTPSETQILEILSRPLPGNRLALVSRDPILPFPGFVDGCLTDAVAVVRQGGPDSAGIEVYAEPHAEGALALATARGVGMGVWLCGGDPADAGEITLLGSPGLDLRRFVRVDTSRHGAS